MYVCGAWVYLPATTRGRKMKPVKEIKRMQVDGKKYLMPVEDVDIEKLIQKGLKLKANMEAIGRELETVQSSLIEIAQARREGTTTITLPGVSGKAVVTFRESFAVGDDIEEISPQLGPLFGRFFKKRSSYSTTPEFKKFMESGHALGIQEPEQIKEAMRRYVTVKETKPNVKFEVKE